MVIVERWLDGISDSVIIGVCNPPGYTIWICLVTLKIVVGEIALGFKTPLKLLTKHSDTVYTTFEHARVTNNPHSVNCVIVYRPPPTENGITNYMFFTEFEQYVTEISLLPSKLILLGDFNGHWDNPTKYDVVRF